MLPTALEDAFDLFGRDERTRGIMHCHVAHIFSKLLEAGANGVLPMFAARNNRTDLRPFLIVRGLFDFTKSILPCDKDDLSHAIRALKGADGMGEHRLSGNFRSEERRVG